MAKAYDRMAWDFLIATLNAFGFNNKFIQEDFTRKILKDLSKAKNTINILYKPVGSSHHFLFFIFCFAFSAERGYRSSF